MPWLTARFASSFDPQVAHGRPFQTVGGGRLAAVGAVESEAPLKKTHLRLQRKDKVHDGLRLAADLRQQFLPADA
jgi:hypothetical protein